MDSTRDLLWASLADAYAGLAATKPESDRRPLFLKAADAYATAIKLKPGNASYLGNYAIDAGKAGKTEEALVATEKAAQLDPANAPRYFLNLGVILVKAGQGREALEALTRVPETAAEFKGARRLTSVATVSVYLDSGKRRFQDLKAEKVVTDADARKALAKSNQSTDDVGHFAIWNSNLTVPGASCSVEERLGSDPRLECEFNQAVTVNELRDSYETLISMVNEALGSGASNWKSTEERLAPVDGLKHIFSGPQAEVQVEVYHRSDEVQKTLQRLPYGAGFSVIATQR